MASIPYSITLSTVVLNLPTFAEKLHRAIELSINKIGLQLSFDVDDIVIALAYLFTSNLIFH